MSRIRRIALDLDSVIDFGEGAAKVAEIWFGPDSTKRLRYSDWGPMVFNQLQPRTGALGWILDQLLDGAEILYWTTSLPNEPAITLQAERWLTGWTGRYGTPIHIVADRLDFIEAQLYIHAGKDIGALGVAENYRRVDVGHTGEWPVADIEPWMDASSRPPVHEPDDEGTGSAPGEDGPDEGDKPRKGNLSKS